MLLEHNTLAFFINLVALMLVGVPLFHLTRSERARDAILATTGLLLIFYIAPRLLIFFVIYWAVSLTFAGMIGAHVKRRNDEPRFIAIALPIVVLLVPLVWWRLDEPHFISYVSVYLNDFIGGLSPELRAVDRLRTLLPVGLSFATFRAIDLLIKMYLGVERPPLSKLLSYAFFPTLLAVGPIAQYHETTKHRAWRSGFGAADYWSGLSQMIAGVFKVFVIAYPLQRFDTVLFHPEQFNGIQIVLGLALYYVFFYFNFSGYSDMAIGSARLFGVNLSPNFNRPLFKPSPQEFWNAWHMSLTNFAQRNVFTPLGGFRKERRYLASAATMLVIALWHNISWGLVVFAAVHTIGILFWPRAKADNPAAMVGSRVATFGFVLMTLPLLLLDLGSAGSFYRSLIPV